MSIATHNVEVSCPEAFASLTRSLFPSAPGYSRNRVPPEGRNHQAARRECALLRDSTLVPFPVSWHTRSCFYRRPCANEPTETRLGCQGARTSIPKAVRTVKWVGLGGGFSQDFAGVSSPAWKAGAFTPDFSKSTQGWSDSVLKSGKATRTKEIDGLSSRQ